MNMRPQEEYKRHIISALVDNEFGALARVVSLFSARGYNIESLTVAEIDHQKQLSRITIVTSGTNRVVEQIKVQLERLIPIHSASDLTTSSAHVERELALVKVINQGEKRVEALRIADIFRARVVDSTVSSFVFEITGTPEKLEAFINLMQPLGLVELCRTGVTAMARGLEILPSTEAELF